MHKWWTGAIFALIEYLYLWLLKFVLRLHKFSLNRDLNFIAFSSKQHSSKTNLCQLLKKSQIASHFLIENFSAHFITSRNECVWSAVKFKFSIRDLKFNLDKWGKAERERKMRKVSIYGQIIFPPKTSVDARELNIFGNFPENKKQETDRNANTRESETGKIFFCTIREMWIFHTHFFTRL